MSGLLSVELVAHGHRFALHYTQGGRLADVFIDDKLVAATQVGDWSWGSSSQAHELDLTALSHELAEWVAENSDDYLRELPYL